MLLPNGMEALTVKPKDVKHLREIVSNFAVYAKVDEEGVVTVENMVGSGQYLARAPAELAWLQANSTEVENQGYLTRYTIKFN
jgi:hypothetical protein